MASIQNEANTGGMNRGQGRLRDEDDIAGVAFSLSLQSSLSHPLLDRFCLFGWFLCRSVVKYVPDRAVGLVVLILHVALRGSVIVNGWQEFGH